MTDCIDKINNTQVDNAKDLNQKLCDQRINNYVQTLGSLWWYHKDDSDDNKTYSQSFKLKARITRRNPATGNTKNVE